MTRERKLIALMLAVFVSGISFAQNADISVFRPAVNPRNKDDQMVRAGTEYTKKTGGKVKYIISDWGNWQSKILSSLAAGEPIDVVFGRDADFPRFYTKGYVQPVDGYVDLTKPYINKTGMDAAFKYGGKYYLASHETSNHPWIIIYNKSLMEEEGIALKDQPLALYERGEWTWAKLRELAMKLTKDTSGSGKIDRWGFGNWYTRGFVYMNGSSFAVNQKDGNQKLNFEDPRFMEALQFLADAKKEGWYMQDNSIIATGVPRRTVVMSMERQYFPATLITQTRDELAYAPLPRGPGVKDSVHIYETDGYGIGNGSTKQKFAGQFIDICLETWYKDDLQGRRAWPQEVFPVTREMDKKRSYFGPLASALDTMIDPMLGEIVWTGDSPSQAIAGWQSQAELLLAEANKPGEKPVRLPFKPIKIDFEKTKLDGFKVGGDGEYKSVKLSIISGKQAIKGKSLLVQLDSDVDGEWIDAVITNPDVLGVVGWRDYRVSFDVKLLSTPKSADTEVAFEIFKDQLNKYGYTSQKLEEANKVYKVSTVVRNINTNGKIPIKFVGHFASDFVIDNIEITER